MYETFPVFVLDEAGNNSVHAACGFIESSSPLFFFGLKILLLCNLFFGMKPFLTFDRPTSYLS